jgi:hypothetical protein
MKKESGTHFGVCKLFESRGVSGLEVKFAEADVFVRIKFKMGSLLFRDNSPDLPDFAVSPANSTTTALERLPTPLLYEC